MFSTSPSPIPMPCDNISPLLNLSDDVLHRIAFFTNRDCYIPFPSFKPHWSNFKSDITSKNQKDYLSFRLTCKRIHDICDLKNLQIRLKSFDSIRKWNNTCPEVVMRGIRRLEIVCPNESEYRRSCPIGAWNILITLFSSLASLEEVIINGYPICWHNSNFISVENEIFRSPSWPILPRVKSISIGIECNRCLILLNRALIPCLPSVQHLRITLPVGQSTPTGLRELSDLWCDRNDQFVIPLQTLVLGYHPSPTPIPAVIAPTEKEDEFCDIIPSVGDLFPDVARFTLAAFRPEIDFMVGACEIHFNHHLESGNQGEGNDDPDETAVLNKFLRSLPSFSKLKHLDWGIQVSLNISRPTRPETRIGQTKKSFTRHMKRNTPAKLQNYLNNYKDALTILAKKVLEHISSLEQGVFWEKGIGESPLKWYRWSWSIIIDENGNSIPVFDDQPLRFSSYFLQRRDGQDPNPSEQSDSDDSEYDVEGVSAEDDDNDDERSLSR